MVNIKLRVLELQIGLLLIFPILTSAISGNYYSEKLHLKPRKSNSLLAQFNFNFIEKLSDDGIVKFSPVLHSVLKQNNVNSLEFSIAQGFWRNKVYGLPPERGAAPGVHLVATFDASTSNLENKWKKLVQKLNGLFCSSFEIIGQTSNAQLQMENSSNQISIYGAFTGDSICTENVESIKKLLPCHRTGLCQLLNNVEMLYESLFYSMGFTASLRGNEWSANVQANILKPIETKQVSVYQLFKQHYPIQCPIANESAVIIEESPRVMIDLKTTDRNAVQTNLNVSRGEIEPLPVEFSSFVRENHLIRGKFISSIRSSAHTHISATFTHLIPWQINLWYSTIKFDCQNAESKYQLKMRPNVVRKSPTLIEMSFNIPPQTNCQISYEFQKRFLHFTEYPPDASNGIYVAGPILTLIPSIESQLRGGKTRIYGEPYVIMLPTPDFSMPFNVVCFVCTIMALIFQRFLTFTTQYISIVDKPPKEGLIRRVLMKLKRCLDRKQKTD